MSNLIKLKQIQGGLTLKQDVARIANLVEHESTGLVTVVGDLKSQVEVLKGNAETEGSVAHSIKQATDALQGKIDGKADASHTHQAAEIVESEDKQFVSSAKKTQYDENTLYTNEMPTVNNIGGIAAGTTFDNMPVNEVLTKLLYPYVAPTVSASSTPNGGVYEKGNNQSVNLLKAVVGKKSEKITKVEFFDGGSSLGVKEGTEVQNGGTFDFTVDQTVNTNKNFTVKVTDAAQKMYSANTGSFTFVYPYYMGVIGAEQTATEEIVKALTKKVETKGNKQHSFTTDNQRMVIAYPKSYGVLKTIIDPNGFDNFASFGRQEIQITGLDGTPQAYYVYVNSPSTVSNFAMKFNY